jgi:hypothetical protein
MNPAAWNLTGLNPQRFNINYPKTSFEWVTPDPEFALWIGDTWRAKENLTINYGLRYTNYWYGATAPGITPHSIPITQYSASAAPRIAARRGGQEARGHDHLDFGPQGGFAYNVGGGGDFVIRGGTGLYYRLRKANTRTRCSRATCSAPSSTTTRRIRTLSRIRPTAPTATGGDLLKGVAQSGAMSNENMRMPMSWQSGRLRNRSGRARVSPRIWSTERRCANW